MRTLITLYTFFLGLFLTCNCQTVQNVKDLRTQLLTTNAYDSTVRPIANQSDALNVEISLNLVALNELNDVEETMKTTAFLVASWNDTELTWTPSSYGDMSGVLFLQDEVWKPDLALKNSNADYKMLGTSKLNVYITSDGTVWWYPFQVFTSTCSMDITAFPFDVQKCDLQFVAWSYVKSEVTLSAFEDGVYLADYQENPSWSILDTAFEVPQDNSDSILVFKIKLQRKPKFVIVFLVLPILMLTIANVFSFVLPVESGERAGYAVTVFLAFAVFLTIVESTMPETSESVALFSVYILLMTALSTVSILLTLVMIRLTTFDANVTRIPRWIITIADAGKCKPCRRRFKTNQVEEFDEKKAYEDSTSSTSSDYTPYTWKAVVNGMDVFCFNLFCFLSVLFTIIFLATAASMAARQAAADM